eukprot:2960431-Alexandrium_andersonii.AAC.1
MCIRDRLSVARALQTQQPACARHRWRLVRAQLRLPCVWPWAHGALRGLWHSRCVAPASAVEAAQALCLRRRA